MDNLRERAWLQVLPLLPKNTISRIIGHLAQAKLPATLVNWWVRCFIRHYDIEMTEVAAQRFASFNEFFTRPLRHECRPIDANPARVTAPVDGIIASLGSIDHGTLIQAKGIDYSLKALVVAEEYQRIFANGHYLTFYLSPRHYHRIHTPVGGTIEELYYIPGTLYPVNRLAVGHIPALFTLNERLLTIIANPEIGRVAVIKIGAMIVGKIKVVYDHVESNKRPRLIHQKYSSLAIDKGAELGRFQMGSTVILLFEPGRIELDELIIGQEVKFGEAIATVKTALGGSN